MVVPIALGLAADGSMLRRGAPRATPAAPAGHRGTLELPRWRRSGLAPPAPRGPPAGARRGGRQPRVARGGFWEPIVLGAAAAAFFGRPKSAPGPSEALRVREESALREVSAARERLARAAPEEAAKAREALGVALEVLAKVEAELKAAELDRENYPVPEYLNDAFSKMKVMLAVTGSSGVGKSSFINVVRRLRPKDAGAARTGVTETTTRPEMFAFPPRQGIFRRIVGRVLATGRGVGKSLLARDEQQEELFQVGDRVLARGLGPKLGDQVAEVVALHGPSSWDLLLGDGRVVKVGREQMAGVLAECVMWDLPGVGTPSYPQATYVKEMGIRYFDLVVLVTATRFTEAELLLVRELESWRVPYFLVRNKVDADVQSELEAEEDLEGGELDEARRQEVALETLQTIKDYFRKELGLERVYCVSCSRRHARQYDFPQLEKDLEEAVSRQRSIDTERECPVCFEVYTEHQGSPGHRRRRRPCGHSCCEACLQTSAECPTCER